MTGAKSAVARIAISMISPSKSGPRMLTRRNLVSASSRGADTPCARPPACPAAIVLLICHPWIEEGVREVDDQVDQDDQEGGHRGDRLHDRVVARGDRLEEELPQPRDREDRLDHDRATDQEA